MASVGKDDRVKTKEQYFCGWFYSPPTTHPEAEVHPPTDLLANRHAFYWSNQTYHSVLTPKPRLIIVPL